MIQRPHRIVLYRQLEIASPDGILVKVRMAIARGLPGFRKCSVSPRVWPNNVDIA